jgi:hypothetical protein
MQNQNWQRIFAVATVAVLIVSFTTLAAAQRVSSEERSAIFASAAKDSTNIKGVSLFAAPPKGFNPLTATDRELLSYGLPQRPDASDAQATAQWQRAMVAARHRADPTKLVAKPFSSRQMMPTPAAAKTNLDGTVSEGSYNWSGIANFNTLTKWNTKTSFDYVVSFFNVPVAQPPFDACSNGIDGPFYTVTWNGIDGAFNGDVVQGGSYIAADCEGDTEYLGWVEWYPSYDILGIFYVNPGDDFLAVTYGAPGTDTQEVFIEDLTLQVYATVSLPYVTGPGLVGRSAEYIVERPCCIQSGYPVAEANYLLEFMGYNYAYDEAGTLFYPGNSGAKTAIFTMYADDGSTPIGAPIFYGTAGSAGKYSITLENEDCAYIGGCTP